MYWPYRLYRKPHTSRYGGKWFTDMMLDKNTNSAHRVEFAESESLHTVIESMQRLSKAPRECSAFYKVLLSGSEAITVTHLTRWVIIIIMWFVQWRTLPFLQAYTHSLYLYTMSRLFLSSRRSTLNSQHINMPTMPFLDSAWPLQTVC